jgi:hypothetical protein
MFEKDYESRLYEWGKFRDELEESKDPLQHAINKYSQAPIVSFQTDPWDQQTWPTPWELILENQYCDFCKILGICYSLQLTDRFSGVPIEIHIGVDNKKDESYYLLMIDNKVIGYESTVWVYRNDVAESFSSQSVYTMEPIQ